MNRVIEAFERVSNHLEDGLNSILSPQGGPQSDPPGNSQQEDQQNYEGSPLDGITEEVLGGIFASQSGPQTFREHVDAFSSAITWNEPFIYSLVIFHLIMIALMFIAVTTKHSRSLEFRVALFVFLAVLVRCSEAANTYLRENFEEYGITQNYFDAKGVFMMVMVCLPLLSVCFILLISFLIEAKNLMITVKRMEIESKYKKKSKASTKPKKNSNQKDKMRGKKIN